MNAKMRGAAAFLAFGAMLLAVTSTPALADKIKHPTAVFAGLDKITGRIIAFEVGTDETVQFGSLLVTPRVCFTRPPTEAPRTDGFVEVDEITEKKTYNRIFTGWMFAASPGLHGVEHPVYDIWLTDCKGGTQVIHTPPEETEEADTGAADVDQSVTLPPDVKAPPPAPKKRKPSPKPVEAAAPAPQQFDNQPPPIAPGQRGAIIRRFFPTDSAPIPPGNVGQ